MQLELYRSSYTDEYTEGNLYIRRTPESNLKWFCNTLEPASRVLYSVADKVPGRTAIPADLYDVRYDWSWKFRRKLPRLQRVKFFDGILIHAGNSVQDTAGCILVGIKSRDGKLTNSRFTLERLCIELQQEGGSCKLLIINGVRKPRAYDK